MNLKDDLIKLGERQPDLRDNIRPVLDHLDRFRRSSRRDRYASRTDFLGLKYTREYAPLDESEVESFLQHVNDVADSELKGMGRLDAEKIRREIESGLSQFYDKAADAPEDEWEEWARAYKYLRFQTFSAAYDVLKNKLRDAMDHADDRAYEREIQKELDAVRDHLNPDQLRDDFPGVKF